MEGIKELLQIPLFILPFEGQSDTLVNQYGPPRATTCYGEGKVQLVTDISGKEVVSAITLYVDGSDVLTKHDKVTYDDETYRIKALSKIKELDGTIALWVVYV